INNDKFRSLRRLYGGLRVLTILAGGLLAALALSLLLSRNSPPIPSHRAEALLPGASASDTARAAAGNLSSPVRVPVDGLKEASGIAWHAALGRFFVVGDRGALAEVEPGGKLLRTHRVKGNLEDVAVHTPSGRLVLLAEKKGELVVWDPKTASETARFPLDVAALLDREPVDRNQGFEGLGFRAEPDLPGGGAFYLVHQRKPARLVSLSFDPTGPVRPIGAAEVNGRHALKPYEDLTAVVWSEALAGLLVIAESEDRLLLVSPAGSIRASWMLPGDRQEGLAIGPDGSLWIADDRQGLFKIPGALEALQSASGSSS
ncbi:MAG TPA: SdiA-regulated domain-containing protein, partial [Planctomycetota bacterium]|nr:SdiA-regulated domain-containing protein [Planctomycetota bacterium]